MCLFPLSIRNPTKVIHTGGGQLLRMQVPCGHCAECLQAKRNEWYIRCHYEIKRTHSLGGYVYFDTLTYNDDNLPKLSHFIDIEKYGLTDFSCFNHAHFKAFLKRLRRKIDYHFGIKKDAFRYFLTTEYGENNIYTHRPHIHILFYVYAPIPALTFSQYVADCWQYGRTDGFPFKPASYVMKHVYEKNSEFKATESVAMYVSKYITKQSGFVKTLNSRLVTLREKLTYYDIRKKPHLTDESKELLKTLKRNIDMFHRQSQGFGLSYLDELTPDKLMFLDEDKVVLEDSKKIVRTYPLPMYYKRKLYYTLKKHADKTAYWEPTEFGINHIINAKLAKIDSITQKYMDIVNNCVDHNLVDRFFTLLGNRDISNYVLYEQFYKGRHRDINAIDYKFNQQNTLTDEEINLNDWLLSISLSLRPYLNCACSLQVDEKVLRVPVLKETEFRKYEDECYKRGEYPELLSNSRSQLIEDYLSRFTFNENTDVVFKDFDKISVLIQQMNEKQRYNKQITFEYLEELKSRYKTLFNLNL